MVMRNSSLPPASTDGTGSLGEKALNRLAATMWPALPSRPRRHTAFLRRSAGGGRRSQPT